MNSKTNDYIEKHSIICVEAQIPGYIKPIQLENDDDGISSMKSGQQINNSIDYINVYCIVIFKVFVKSPLTTKSRYPLFGNNQ
jgi:hypothetical protein